VALPAYTRVVESLSLTQISFIQLYKESRSVRECHSKMTVPPSSIPAGHAKQVDAVAVAAAARRHARCGAAVAAGGRAVAVGEVVPEVGPVCTTTVKFTGLAQTLGHLSDSNGDFRSNWASL
jgi:hypothetical protein